MRLALSTGGGDAPGLNAVIRTVVLSSMNRGWEVLGIKRGFGVFGNWSVVVGHSPIASLTAAGGKSGLI